MPIPSVEHWEENARLVEVLAEGMGGDPTRLAMPETARLIGGSPSCRHEAFSKPASTINHRVGTGT